MDDVKTGVAIILDALELREDDLEESQLGNVEEFVRISIECDDEILGGIDHQIPMTADLYHRTIARLEALGATRALMEFRSDFKDFSN